jgi:hypothetical protein
VGFTPLLAEVQRLKNNWRGCERWVVIRLKAATLPGPYPARSIYRWWQAVCRAFCVGNLGRPSKTTAGVITGRTGEKESGGGAHYR